MPAFYQSTHSLSIQAPPEKVFEALTDWAQRSQWRKGIDLTWEGDSRAYLNQEVIFKVRSFIPYTFSYRVTGLEPPLRLFVEYSGKPLKGRGALEITPEKEGCQVAFHWMKVEPGGLATRIYFALGLGMRAHRVRTMETLRMLKEYLEKSPQNA